VATNGESSLPEGSVTSPTARSGVSHGRAVDPRNKLRRMALIGLVAGALFVATAVVGTVAFTPSGANDAAATSSVTHGWVFLGSMGILGLIELGAGVIALMAHARFPDVASLDGPLDALPFAAGVLTFLSAVALVVIAAGGFAAVVVAAFGVIYLTTSGIRKALAAGETARRAESSAPA
jgi:hypothetical protein